MLRVSARTGAGPRRACATSCGGWPRGRRAGRRAGWSACPVDRAFVAQGLRHRGHGHAGGGHDRRRRRAGAAARRGGARACAGCRCTARPRRARGGRPPRGGQPGRRGGGRASTRGDVLTRPGTLRADVDRWTWSCRSSPASGRSRTRRACASTWRAPRCWPACGVLDAPPAVAPGTTRRVQLRLEKKAVAGRGDRLVVRSYSPAATIGGAVVLDPLARRRKRGAAAAAAAARSRSLDMVSGGRRGRASTRRVASRGSPSRGRRPARGGGPGATWSRWAASRGTWSRARRWTRLAEAAAGPAGRVPRRAPAEGRDAARGAARAGLRARRAGRLRARPRQDLAAAARSASPGDGVALAGHAVRLTPEEERARAALADAARGAGWEGLEPEALAGASGLAAALAERVTRVLVAEGELRKVGDALLHRERTDALKAEVRRRWPSGTTPRRGAAEGADRPQPQVRDPAAGIPGPREGDAAIRRGSHRPVTACRRYDGGNGMNE